MSYQQERAVWNLWWMLVNHAVVSYRSETGAGEAGSVASEGDAESKGTTGSMESSGDVKEVHVVRSSGSNPPSGDPDGGNTNGRRFLGTCISKISGQ